MGLPHVVNLHVSHEGNDDESHYSLHVTTFGNSNGGPPPLEFSEVHVVCYLLMWKTTSHGDSKVSAHWCTPLAHQVPWNGWNGRNQQ